MGDEGKVRLGISSCLLGNDVRYNGGHLNDSFLTGTISKYVEWVAVCPEVEMGMGVPRETIQLQGKSASPRLIATKTGVDHTEGMRSFAEARVAELGGANLDGFVLTKDSPSCGLMRVKVHRKEGGPPSRDGIGAFAWVLTTRMPDLPVEENGRLTDPRLRENFVDRIFVRRRWRAMLHDSPTPRGLVSFHTAHKLTFMAHSIPYYREAGRIVAHVGSRPWDELVAEYARVMREALTFLATPSKHTNVMHHLMGYLKKAIDGGDKQELLGLIEEYRQERVPLVVPLTLLKHHLRKHDLPAWVHQQAYLSPYPEELMLRNHV
ncbi:MAG: DUF1722 domain-containing protein [SAR202 cluster bacterium]|nr:DUF1722 domain-containing protein [SAR202 cluster bacterium]